jgi:hypothetical protein
VLIRNAHGSDKEPCTISEQPQMYSCLVRVKLNSDLAVSLRARIMERESRGRRSCFRDLSTFISAGGSGWSLV